jgi:hypothetical protein
MMKFTLVEVGDFTLVKVILILKMNRFNCCCFQNFSFNVCNLTHRCCSVAGPGLSRSQSEDVDICHHHPTFRTIAASDPNL